MPTQSKVEQVVVKLYLEVTSNASIQMQNTQGELHKK